MSCVLRVSGPCVKASLSNLTLEPFRIEDEVVHFDVSKADFNNFKAQIKDAIEFLQQYRAEVKLMMSGSDANGVLDFAIEWRDVAVQFDKFPAALVSEAGSLGLELELSHYPPSEDAPLSESLASIGERRIDG